MQIDLGPDEYRTGLRVVSKKFAQGMLIYCTLGALILQWILLRDAWWIGFLIWPPLLMAGAYITRLWPLFFLRGKD